MNMELATFLAKVDFSKKVFCIFIIVFQRDLSGWYIFSNIKRYTTSLCTSVHPKQKILHIKRFQLLHYLLKLKIINFFNLSSYQNIRKWSTS